MARLARVIAPGYPHHVTQRGDRSLSIFRNDEDRKMYLEFMARETKRFGVKILAGCLMTDYVPLIDCRSRDGEGIYFRDDLVPAC